MSDKFISDERHLGQSDLALIHAARIDDGPTGNVNQILRIGYGFARFIAACNDDVDGAAEYGLEVVDRRDEPKAREFRSGKPLAHAKDAFGEGLDESVQLKLVSYVPTVSTKQLSPCMRALAAYGSLAGRVAKLETADEDMPRVERRAMLALDAMRALDPEMWRVFSDADGDSKQWLDGMRASALEIDGHSQTNGSVYKGQCEHTRNDPTAQAFIRNGKATHAYVAATGSISERDLAAA